MHGWHCVSEPGLWDIENLYADLRKNLVHSHWRGLRPAADGGGRKCYSLVFAKQRGVLVAVSDDTADCSTLCVWARSPHLAAAELSALRAAYFHEQWHDEKKACFFVLTTSLGDLEARIVKTNPVTHASDELKLHYGDDFEEWHRQS
jgi:hypothetical protein